MNPSSEISGFIKKFKVKCFYHFTHISNIALIKNHEGIFSLRELQQRKIESLKFLSDEYSRKRDLTRGLDGYVRLTFKRWHVLAARNRGLADFLEIDPSILMVEGVKVADGVGYAKHTNIYDLSVGLTLLDFDILYSESDPDDPDLQQRKEKALNFELLVPKQITKEFIRL